jgi:hypothetical protein
MKNIYIIDIEPLDNRYTKQWYYFIPRHMKKLLPDKNIVQISGDTTNYKSTTSGKFFDFSKTCDYKASQARKISQLFIDNKVQPHDVFFFTDAWNQSVHTLKYLSELNNIPVKIVGIWHAGWYDKTDILGQTIKNTEWVKSNELSMYNAYDINFFGTRHHLDTFMAEHTCDRTKALTTGYPLDYLEDMIQPDYKDKQDIVVFPHRLNDDKAPHVFDWIAHKVQSYYPDILFVKTQEHSLDKDEYYKLLSKAKVVFSCSKHENLGIGTYEAVRLGCVPMVPDKLSYKEMYPISNRYHMDDNLWYEKENVWVDVAERILDIVKTYDKNRYNESLNIAKHIRERFFTGDNMFYIIDRL